MLNGRVRNGNGCGHPGVLTGKSPGRRVGARRRVYQQVAVKVGSLREPRQVGPRGRACAAEERINAVKRLAVSTGQLRRLPALHTRPIDLVVYQEPSTRKGPETWSWRGF